MMETQEESIYILNVSFSWNGWKRVFGFGVEVRVYVYYEKGWYDSSKVYEIIHLEKSICWN